MTPHMAKRLVCCLSVIALMAAGVALVADADAAEAMTVSTAINKAGRQRMLSQRLAKAYLMVGQGILPERANGLLKDSLSLFDAQLAELKGFVPNDGVRVALAQLERAWNEYRPMLTAPADAKGASQVYELNELVQTAAHRLTLAYEKSAAGRSDRLVNIAGRQRMLSQRMAKYYLFQVWGVNTPAARMELNLARTEFSSAMHQLYIAPRTIPEIDTVLKNLDREWIQYREALSVRRDAAEFMHAAADIVERSEHVLELTEKLVALYEQQAKAANR